MKKKDLMFAIILLLLKTTTSCSLEIGTRISTKTNPVSTNGIKQNGITVTFDRTYTAGQYITGDYWIIDPGSGVIIESTSHVPASGVLFGEHLTKNPQWNKEAMDSREMSYNASYALSLPGVLHAGDSVIVNTSLAKQNGGSYIYSAIILTIVDTAQSTTKFRPPYARPSRIAASTTDPLLFDFASISPEKWAELPGLSRSKVSGLEAITTTTARINARRPWIDITNAYSGWCSPINQMEPYGRDLCSEIGVVCAQLCLDYSISDLQLLSAYLIQYGIDTYGVILDGGFFNANGGTNSGRKIGIVFAAEMLGSSALASVPQMTTVDGATFYTFQEDGQTYRYDDSAILPNYTNLPSGSVGEIFYDSSGSGRVSCLNARGQLDILNGGIGDAALWRTGDGGPGTTSACLYEHIPIADWDEIATDNAENKWEGYRACCTSHVWIGQALLMLLWKNTNLITLWNHDVFFDYIYRWMTQSVAAEIAYAKTALGVTSDPIGFYWPQGTQPTWVKNVYEAYKGSFNYTTSYYAP
jgi:hypothetical protein